MSSKEYKKIAFERMYSDRSGVEYLVAYDALGDDYKGGEGTIRFGSVGDDTTMFPASEIDWLIECLHRIKADLPN